MSFVYIASLLDKTAYKIGKSLNPLARINDLSKYYKFDLENVYIINCNNNDNAFKLENMLHSLFESFRVIFEYDGGTEFFSYNTFDEMIKIVESIIKLKGYSKKLLISTDYKETSINEIECIISSISVKVQNKRLEYNLSQEQLSKISGVCLNSIKSIENPNSRRGVTLFNFISILSVLNLDYIFDDLEVEESKRIRASNKR